MLAPLSAFDRGMHEATLRALEAEAQRLDALAASPLGPAVRLRAVADAAEARRGIDAIRAFLARREPSLPSSPQPPNGRPLEGRQE